MLAHRRQSDGGHLLLAILLMLCLMVIAATYEAPKLVQQMKRDREDEMIHRGTEYARAIKKYYRKFGRYPANLDQLDNTNNIRFIRKRYTDPLTKDGKWKLLHYGDIQMLQGGMGTAAAMMGTMGGQTPGMTNGTVNPNAFTNASSLGSSSFGSNSTFGSTSSFGSGNGFGSALGGSSPTSSFGANAQQQSSSIFGNSASGTATSGGSSTDTTGGTTAENTSSGSTPGQSGSSVFSNTFSLNSNSNSSGDSMSSGNSGSPTGIAGGQTFGGGAIVGVASLSNDPTIRIYNKKKKYSEWQFIFDPSQDRPGVLLRGPYQPITIGGNTNIGTPAGQLNQQGNTAGQPNNSFGNSGATQQQQITPSRNFPPDQVQQ